MPFKWLLAVILIWFAFGLFGGAMNTTGVGENQTNTLQLFLQPLTASTAIPFVGNILAAVTDKDWWNAAVTMATFDFPAVFPENSGWQMVRWGGFMCLGGAFMFTLALAVFRGTPST